METFTFHEGPLPAGVALNYEPAIFNLPAFVAFHYPGLSFYILDQKRKKAVAGIHFHVSGRIARSAFKAPFGSVEATDDLNPNLFYRFLEFFEQRLKASGVSEIHIKNPPRAYAPHRLALLEVFLFNQKYYVHEAEPGSVLELTGKTFSSLIRSSEKLRLQQARKAACTFYEVPLNHFAEVYEFISARHQEKGYSLSVAASELQRTIGQFPHSYVLFVVRQGEKMLAASVCVRVNKKILYHFLTNHEKEFNQLSPALVLAEGIYDYCGKHDIQLFDLGTSALQGKPNFTLLDFKMHLGATATSKISFAKYIG